MHHSAPALAQKRIGITQGCGTHLGFPLPRADELLGPPLIHARSQSHNANGSAVPRLTVPIGLDTRARQLREATK
eukprot:8436617-Alexandrium_andersonii.AAC.1